MPAQHNPNKNPLVAGFHSRGYLPHLKSEGKSYFVTFRLADTLPKSVLLEERERIIQNALTHKRPLTWQEQEDLFVWYSTKVDSYLDAGHGECFLRQPRIAKLISDAIRFFEGQRYEMRAWVVVPNHVHAVVWPKPPNTLSAILHSWKSFTANEANKILRRVKKSFWQEESYDHFIRDDDDMARCCRYTIYNPVNAGLCPVPHEWQWSSAYSVSTKLAAGMPPEPAGRDACATKPAYE